MKALVLREDAIGIEEVEGPTKPTHVEGPFITLNVLCCALNHRDQYIREGLYSKIKLPAILGSDVCGVIEGRRMIVDPTFNWGEDEAAQARDMHILGMPTQGGLAEQIIVPVDHLHPAPQHLSNEEAASLPVAGVTAWRALMHQGRCSKTDVVLVTGAGGGVATFVMQFALAVGCKVIITSRSQEKLDRLTAHEDVRADRVTSVVMDDKGAWVDAVKQLKPTLIVDSIGGAIINNLVDVLVPGGRLILYGSSSGVAPSLNLHRIFWKQLTVKGSTMGTEDDFADMLSFIERQMIHPIIDKVYALDEAVDAFERMKDSEQVGKIVIRVRSEE